MRRRTGFYPIILTSIVCMLAGSAFAASSVRVLGATGSNGVVGTKSDATTGASIGNTVKSGVSTSSVSKTARASSLRFAPTVSGSGVKAVGAENRGAASNAINPSARLSIGKYLNLSHSDKVVPTGNSGSSSSGTGISSSDIDELRAELDKVKDQVDDKQNVITATDNYINIAGKDNNEISIDMDALAEDLQNALGTDKKIKIEFDDTDNKLYWCYADGDACSNTNRELVVDLGSVLNTYKLDEKNTHLANKFADLESQLAGKQGKLLEAEDGYITINEEVGTIDVKFDALKDALGIADSKGQSVEIEWDKSVGKMRYRYANEYEDEPDPETGNRIPLWHTADIGGLIDASLENYVETEKLKDYILGFTDDDDVVHQGVLKADADGYVVLSPETGVIDVDFAKLQQDLGISNASRLEMEVTESGVLRWRYQGEDEWNNVENINDLIDGKLAGLQGALTPKANGYLEIDGNEIGVKLEDLRTALNIPEPQSKIEIEITNAGDLRWRYQDEFEADGETKKWTTVAANINDLIDGKLADYVDSDALTSRLNSYITSQNLSDELTDYATKQYVDTGLATKQAILTEAENGYIEVNQQDATIGIKFNDLKTALGIDNLKTSQMRYNNGVLQYRYTDDFEVNSDTGERTEKWTDVVDLEAKLADFVTEDDLLQVVNRIDTDLAGKQIRLTPTQDGYILLNQQTGEIGVNMYALKSYLADEGMTAKTSELRVNNGKLQWRYLDDYTEDQYGNNVARWTDLDLGYVEQAYLAGNYYNKRYIDSLAQTIENNINETLERLAIPEEGPTSQGLYLLSVEAGQNAGEKVSSWQAVQIVDGEGVVH